MKRQIYILYIIFGVGLSLYAQEKLPKILLDVPPDTIFVHTDSLKKTFQLPDQFIIPGSERLHLKHFTLTSNLHYQIDYRRGQIAWLKEMPSMDSLRIIYRKYPFPLIGEYYHRELKALPSDSLGSDSVQVTAREVKPKFLDDIDVYQSNLQKSGSIVRGIEIGSNQDLTLNSGLNLQLSGQIAPNVELVAALTDESTPIQPEGNTQNLREVDKVFVKINSPYLGGTLGDFNLQYQNSLFGNLQRKLQGITVENDYRTTHQQITFGTSRGFFHSNRFLAQEGNQGPYLLTGRNGERDIIVLAGTEKVYIDGVLQVRGENNDYVIDYSQAQLTFTNKKLVTSENRIEVDFEYTTNFQRYGRNFLGLSSVGIKIGKRIRYDVRFFREWDDTNSLLEDDAPLTEEEKAALATAGDNPLASVISGVDSVGPGKGVYNKVIDFFQGQLDTFFVYVGRDSGAFTIRFSNVGAGNGDYRRARFGVFEYVGKGRGSYLPVKLVPLAGDKRFANLGLGVQLTRQLNLQAELAASQFDQNIFSGKDDGDNNGTAYQLGSTFQDSSLKVLGKKIGKVRLNGRWKKVQDTYAPLDRPLQPEYAYQWNLDQANLTLREESYEGKLLYQPRRYLTFTGSLGGIDKGNGVTSNRFSSEAKLERTVLPDIATRLENVTGKNISSESDWLRQSVVISKRIRRFTPAYSFRREDRTVDNLSSGKLTGFLFDDHLFKLNVSRYFGLEWGISLEERRDFLYNPDIRHERLDQAVTRTYQAQGKILPGSALKGRFSFAFRKKDFTDFFEQLPNDSMAKYLPDAQFQDTTWQDRQSNLANFELQYRNKANTFTARWDYKVASELQALREKVYIEVGENRGNFRFDSTLNEYVPDPLGNFVLLLLQTGDFESVTNLETALQIQYRPRSTTKKVKGWKGFAKRLSVFSYVKVEEQSREKNIEDIYLLNLSKFHNVRSSLRGVYVINQDLYYNERNPTWGILLRSRYRDNLSNQFLDPDNNESRIIWERIVQARRRVFNRKLNLIGEYKNSFSKRWVTASPSRNANILGQVINGKLNYRPSLHWQFELDVARGFERDRNTQSLLQVNFWEIKPQIAYSIRGRARATANMSYINVKDVENPNNRVIPFEMGKGKKVGDSWLWNVRFEYFISNHITINANYNGRKDADAARTIHLGKAEVRAFF